MAVRWCFARLTCVRHLASNALLLLAGCALTGQPVDLPPALAHALAELQANPSLAGGRIGVQVVDAATGAVLVEAAADRGFAPASNLKLISSAVAVMTLGPEFRFTTILAMRGAIAEGVLHGDLLLQGHGDPTLGAGAGAVDVGKHFAAALRARGIRAVTGRVVGDASWLGEEHLGHGWQWDYLDEDYASPFGALCWNGNLQRVLVDVSDGGVRVGLQPPGAVPLVAGVDLVPSGGATNLVARRGLGSQVITVTGSIAADAGSRTLAVTVPEPTVFAARELTMALRAEGIEIREGAADASIAASVAPVSEWTSQPLATLLMRLLGDSDNLYAEQVFRVAARQGSGARDSASAAQHAVGVLQQLGVECAGLVLADGSGLSRRDLVQPRQLASLLLAMERSAHRAAFVAALPIAGKTGTLRSRFRDTKAAGRVRAKTGTIARVACLSGYLPRSNGAPLVFSVMLNDFVCGDAAARAAIDAFVLRLVEFADAEPVLRSVRTSP